MIIDSLNSKNFTDELKTYVDEKLREVSSQIENS